jgi:hypothetical protein
MFPKPGGSKFSNIQGPKLQCKRLLLDVSNIKKNSFGGKNMRHLANSMKWSNFARRMGKLIYKVMHFIKFLKAQDPNKARFVYLDPFG